MAPTVEPHTANAIGRSLPRKVALSRDSVHGRIAAPPIPCSTRARTRIGPEVAVAASTLAAVKSARPMTSARRLPIPSAARPTTINSAARVSVYASCIHCVVAAETSRSTTMAGIATLMMVTSMMTSDTAALRNTNPSHHLGRSPIVNSESKSRGFQVIISWSGDRPRKRTRRRAADAAC